MHEDAELEVLASDHSWHRASVIPSVNIIQDVPEELNASWRNGTLCVTVKDAVLEASSPWRHHAELLKQLRALADEKDFPFVLVYKTDGGPDHNMKNGSVQVALIALFLAGDFDALIAHRLAYRLHSSRCSSLAILTH